MIPVGPVRPYANAAIAVMGDPALDAKGLAKIVKGPDFPTGGIILGKQGIHDYIERGRGSIQYSNDSSP